MNNAECPHRKNTGNWLKYSGTVLKCLQHTLHSKGHASRLGRFSERPTLVVFGSLGYSKGKLISEIGGIFLNAFAGIKDTNFNNSLAYLKGWL